MKKEIDKAVETFHKIAFGSGKRKNQLITDKQLASFVTVLTELLLSRYRHNWYPENPSRGSGYRCLRMNGQCIDPTILESFMRSGIKPHGKLRTLELTVWVDPGVVSIRIGEEGSIGTEDIEMEPIPEVDESSSEDEAYASRTPSPITRPDNNKTPVMVTTSVQAGSPSTSPVCSMAHGNFYQNINPRSMPPMNIPPPPPSGLSNARPVVMNPTYSQEFMATGNIPAPQQSYSRPRNLFPPTYRPHPQDMAVNGSNAYQGYYKDGMVAYPAHHAATTLAQRMQHTMMMQANYDIPAQA